MRTRRVQLVNRRSCHRIRSRASSLLRKLRCCILDTSRTYAICDTESINYRRSHRQLRLGRFAFEKGRPRYSCNYWLQVREETISAVKFARKIFKRCRDEVTAPRRGRLLVFFSLRHLFPPSPASLLLSSRKNSPTVAKKLPRRG